MNARDQHRHVATLQKGWRADAMVDRRYNLNRARIEQRKGNRVLARAYRREAGWCLFWGNRRGAIARKETRMGK